MHIGKSDREDFHDRTDCWEADDLGQLALYVQVMAQGNTTVLETSRFPLRQWAPRAQSPLPPGPPANVKASRGPVSGSILVSAARVPTAGGYDVQVTSGDPGVETNRTEGGTFKG